MRIKTAHARIFKRFHDLTIDLGETPKKIIALIGKNGCGKSCVFDMFENSHAKILGWRNRQAAEFYAKQAADIESPFNEHTDITITTLNNVPITKKSFVIRSAYRYTSNLNITALTQLPDILDDHQRPGCSIQLDGRLTDNYQRMNARVIHEVFNVGTKTGNEIKAEMLSSINEILDRVLDIKITSLGNITNNNEGKFFFKKGSSNSFPYESLSSGEKEVIDIIIDLIVRQNDYDDTVFCIDEPELHLSTAIQRKLLIEIDKLIPDNCQLWIATHSIGFLRALQDDLKSKTQIINFDGHDFDCNVKLNPIEFTRNNWKKIFQTALEDLTGLIAPRVLIYCEGRKEPSETGDEAGLDAIVYNTIFENEFPDVLFVSSGGQTEPNTHSELTLMILSKALKDIDILVFRDKDMKSDGTATSDSDRDEWLSGGSNRRMLQRKEIENYLFDYEVIKKAYPNVTETEYNSVISDITNSDVKKSAGALKNLCDPKSKMNKEEFKIHLSHYLTESMNVYNELKNCIFLIKTTL